MPPNSTSTFHNPENKWFGIYRARVITVNIEEDGEKNKFGAIKIFLPDVISKEINKEHDEFKTGILAYPANSPVGAYTSEFKQSYFQSSVYIPQPGSLVFIFFEGGDISRPFYLAGCQLGFDENDKITPPPLPPECRKIQHPNQSTLIFKSGDGRAIVVCDSLDQQRVQITGKKRKMKEGPSGDFESVYQIEKNCTTILLDEKEGNERLLIKTHLGDYLELNITKRTLELSMESDVKLKGKGKLSLEFDEGIEVLSKKDININSESNMNLLAKADMLIRGENSIQESSSGDIHISGTDTIIQLGASSASAASPLPLTEGKDPIFNPS